MKKLGGKIKQPFYKRKAFWWPIGIILGLILAVFVAFKISPWPGALVVRYVFSQDGAKSTQALARHVPDKDITRLANQSYRENDPDALLDVYFPTEISQDKKFPVLIWTHGGAWLSGSKDMYVQYFKILSAAGITVIAPNYSLAPEKTYPTAIHQLNDAYDYIKTNADRFHADTSKIFLAGDSAGSQLSAQMAAIITNPDYAKEVDVTPSLEPSELKGVLLNCGIYKMEGLIHPAPELPKIIGWGDDVAVWAYTGSRDFSNPIIKQMSPYYHVTSAFPPTYISGGNDDPLTDAQSKPFAEELKRLGVDVTTRFFSADHQPKLPHEYQFNLDTEDGKKALQAMWSFVEKYASEPTS
ncbi:MAG TPA: alpha/beta hydrolase [Candidatus Saccharimonadales bacterium]|nr:alpha/beta hydrolase [Candidatus Saccharimonadales bacterium]